MTLKNDCLAVTLRRMVQPQAGQRRVVASSVLTYMPP
jgi:hypothetical protein